MRKYCVCECHRRNSAFRRIFVSSTSTTFSPITPADPRSRGRTSPLLWKSLAGESRVISMNKISGIKIHFLLPPPSLITLLHLSHPTPPSSCPTRVGAEFGFAGGVMAFLFSFLFLLLNNLLRFEALLYLSPRLFSLSPPRRLPDKRDLARDLLAHGTRSTIAERSNWSIIATDRTELLGYRK